LAILSEAFGRKNYPRKALGFAGIFFGNSKKNSTFAAKINFERYGSYSGSIPERSPR
jgi:hypothetical protein